MFKAACDCLREIYLDYPEAHGMSNKEYAKQALEILEAPNIQPNQLWRCSSCGARLLTKRAADVCCTPLAAKQT